MGTNHFSCLKCIYTLFSFFKVGFFANPNCITNWGENTPETGSSNGGANGSSNDGSNGLNGSNDSNGPNGSSNNSKPAASVTVAITSSLSAYEGVGAINKQWSMTSVLAIAILMFV